MEKPEPAIKGEIKPETKRKMARNKSVQEILEGSDHFVDCDRFYN